MGEPRLPYRCTDCGLLLGTPNAGHGCNNKLVIERLEREKETMTRLYHAEGELRAQAADEAKALRSRVAALEGALAAQCGYQRRDDARHNSVCPIHHVLSPAERESRRPVAPAVAMNALHGTVHEPAAPAQEDVVTATKAPDPLRDALAGLLGAVARHENLPTDETLDALSKARDATHAVLFPWSAPAPEPFEEWHRRTQNHPMGSACEFKGDGMGRTCREVHESEHPAPGKEGAK